METVVVYCCAKRRHEFFFVRWCASEFSSAYHVIRKQTSGQRFLPSNAGAKWLGGIMCILFMMHLPLCEIKSNEMGQIHLKRNF